MSRRCYSEAMSTGVAKSRAGLVLIWLYLTIALPVPVVLFRFFVWFREIHWKYKYGNPSRQAVASCPVKGCKVRRSRMRSILTGVRDLIDIGAFMWRNPETDFVNMYHALEAGKTRSESVYYSWGSMFSKAEESTECAIAVYRRGLEIYPDSGLLRENLLSLLMDLQNWHEVAHEAALLGWFASGRSRYWAYSCLGYAQFQMGDYEAAAEAYTMALKLKSDSAETVAALRYCREQWTNSSPVDPA